MPVMIYSRLSTLNKLFPQTGILVSCFMQASAQTLLDKRISVHLSRERLEDVLGEISQKGGFYFSYNGNILPKESLVNIAAASRYALCWISCSGTGMNTESRRTM